ncbi:DUF2147 domain-containing protein [Chryseobacterium daecheongense]|uniref:DUF2147 domain-containing protein n=1 Tax=Chryseobacterium daecheongense TaxID=192389 RepID=A0A3N0W4P9_9FLAO|nr:DUF2147 domain-containing protein [Chryseobacterium daecheongense]ROI00047.1 DUF2147 domain-containing protein [Chryseobacterium daecheongense]TDX95014.1 uncharacterized protein (DUF2147 family) [Chryseobacterium daecheongense]
MKKAILTVVLMLISLTSFAQKISPDNIVGVWQCVDYKIEIFRSEGSYSAKLLWSKDMFEADGKTPKKDVKNPNEKLRNRSIQGIVHISALIFKDGEYVDGKLYSVQDGNTYSLKAKLKSVNDLETRGYKGIPMIGKTFNWKRVR